MNNLTFLFFLSVNFLSHFDTGACNGMSNVCLFYLWATINSLLQCSAENYFPLCKCLILFRAELLYQMRFLCKKIILASMSRRKKVSSIDVAWYWKLLTPVGASWGLTIQRSGKLVLASGSQEEKEAPVAKN